VVTVSRPYPTSFITGGGYWCWRTRGIDGGRRELTPNFDSTSSTTERTNLQGRINTIVRRQGRVYQIKGNSMTSLSVQPAAGGGKATFTGRRASRTSRIRWRRCRSTGTPRCSHYDRHGEPGNSDLIGITVWNKSAAVAFEQLVRHGDRRAGPRRRQHGGAVNMRADHAGQAERKTSYPAACPAGLPIQSSLANSARRSARFHSKMRYPLPRTKPTSVGAEAGAAHRQRHWGLRVTPRGSRKSEQPEYLALLPRRHKPAVG